MPTRNYDVFISYRRQGGDAQALFIREKLLQRNIRVFLDVTDLKKGYFDEKLLARIAEAPNFVVILSPNSLDRCEDAGDWLRQEIAQAVKTDRNIIPVMMPGFVFPRELPADVQALQRHQGVEYSHVYFDGMLARILGSIEAERAESERLERERLEKEKLKEEAERREQEKVEAERRALEQAEAGRLAREKADRERRKREKAQEERLVKEKAERERLAREKAEAEIKAAKQAEAERQARKTPKTVRGTAPAPVVPAAPSAQRRKFPWIVAAVAGLIVVALIVYMKSPGSNQTPPQTTHTPAPDQSASGAAGGSQPAASERAHASEAGTQRESIGLQSTPAARTGARLALRSLAQEVAAAEDIFTDNRTGLMWTSKDNGSDLSWDRAQQYCAQLTLGGYTGWRLPTNDELTGIYDGHNVSGKYQLGTEELSLHTINGFHLSNYVIWSEEAAPLTRSLTLKGSDAAGFFRFNDGEHFRVRRENLKTVGAFPALCVRSSKQ